MSCALKRSVDVLVSGTALIVLAPLLVLLAGWIRWDSRGPALFSQERVGRGGTRFRVLKFRTMIDRSPDEIDQHREVVVSTNVDARITWAGRFLRVTSLDELPQLWNIFRGEMSLVGPRPVLPEQIEAIPPEYHVRFAVSPGLTGLAQVRGRRSLGWLDQLAADAEYVSRRSLTFDMEIVLKTIVVVLTGSGIYGDKSKNWRAYRDLGRDKDGKNEKISKDREVDGC